MVRKKTKIIFYIFLISHQEAEKDYYRWTQKHLTFKDLDVDWWVKPKGASHLGLGYQSILNTSDIEKAKEISESISEIFENDCLILLKRGNVKQEPINKNNDKVFHSIGNLFDNLVREKTKGIFIDQSIN